jgi:HD-GYP domain-containing protein (c-di-GMP phosphodiesterase class II)
MARAGKLAAEFNGIVDVDLLLERMIDGAKGICRAEAGSIYLLRENRLLLAMSRNDYLERVVAESGDLPFLNSYLPLDRTSLAGYVALEDKPLNISDTGAIDLDAPYQHNSGIDRDTNYFCQSILTLPLRCPGSEILGVMQLINPLDEGGKAAIFKDEDEKALIFFSSLCAMALERNLMLRSMAIRNVEVVSAHDPMETVAHAQRVACLCCEIYEHWAERQRISSLERNRILNLFPLAAMLHDIGKTSIPREILSKPGRLDMVERAVMEGHVLVGARVFAKGRTPLDRLTFTVIMDHHERWDGQGYPGWVDLESGEPLPGKSAKDGRAIGKKGEEISIFGRILAAADVYDALSTRKAWKEPFDESLSVQIMEQESGHHFDPQVIESLLARRAMLKKIRERFPDSPSVKELDREPPLAKAPMAYL